jgi:DNA-binding XRE family transcriptional regulator
VRGTPIEQIPRLHELRQIGEVIREWRRSVARLTREQLAPRLDVSVATLARWESGTGPGPHVTHLLALERIAPGIIAAIARLSPEMGKPVNSTR